MKLIKANESNASRRRVFFHLVDGEDGITPETGEASGQPQVSVDGSAWTDTGISTLTAIGHGRYYATLTQALISSAGLTIETRYKSANTAECPGDTVQVVAFDPHDADALGLSRIDADITSRAAPGDEMDFIDAPNEAAVDVIQAGLATGSDIAGVPAAVWSESTRTLTAFSFLTSGAIADAVWDEALAGHDTTGSAGAGLAAAGSAGDPWSTLLPGSYTAGQAGKIVGDYLDAAVSSRSTYAGGDEAPTASEVAAAVWGESTRTLTAFSFLTSGGIADAVWDEALASHDTAGTAGAQLANASASGDPLASAVPGIYETGTAGDALARVYDIRSIVQVGAGHE